MGVAARGVVRSDHMPRYGKLLLPSEHSTDANAFVAMNEKTDQDNREKNALS